MPIHAAIRKFQSWCCRLRRALSANLVITLFVLLTIGLGEPLLCIIHCNIWLPLVRHSQPMHSHTHDHAHMNMSGQAHDPLATHTTIPPWPAHVDCIIYSGPNPRPFHVPPSPVHEMILALGLPLLLLTLVAARIAAWPSTPARICFAPPLRPPIAAYTSR